MSGWHICEAAPWLRDPIIRDARGWAVATAVQPNNARAADIDVAANARLIAAAPELLEALEWAVETADTEQYEADWYAAARAAIRKAKGNHNG